MPDATCARCGAVIPLPPSGRRGPRSKYCATRCRRLAGTAMARESRARARAIRAPQRLVCEHCATPFESSRRRRFCTELCGERARNSRHFKNMGVPLEGSCLQCGATYSALQQNRGRQRFCSKGCHQRYRDTHVVEWRLCPRCTVLYPVSSQALRKARPGHQCHPVEHVPKDVICLRCMVLVAGDHSHPYQPVEPHDITCVLCGGVYVGKWTNKCPACVSINRRETRRRTKRLRRARVGAAREPYRVADVFDRDGWRCHLCGRATKRDAKVPHPRAPTIDHLVPLSAGGGDTPLNVATAHFSCNTARGARGLAQLRLVA